MDSAMWDLDILMPIVAHIDHFPLDEEVSGLVENSK